MANHIESFQDYSALASLAVVSTYPPTRCGLATFSAALLKAIRTVRPDLRTGVVAVDDDASDGAPRVTAGARDPIGAATRWPDPAVVATLTDGTDATLRAVARTLNTFDVVMLQHEYGIFPGADGVAVLRLLELVERPVITVLHTVLRNPSPSQRFILEQVTKASAASVVMTEVARTLLLSEYHVDAGKVHVIPHGAWVATDHTPRHGTPHPLLLTWGLLGPGKGLESMIDALYHLRDLDPAPHYLIAGQVHPKVRERSGDAYRQMLIERARERGVGDLVMFDDRYLDRAALTDLIRRADVVVLPYESREQVTSGVLVDAIACGRPVVATAFPHAVELCGRGAGITVPHGDPSALAQALRRIITDPQLAVRLEHGARRIAAEHSWTAVAERHVALAEQLSLQAEGTPTGDPGGRPAADATLSHPTGAAAAP